MSRILSHLCMQSALLAAVIIFTNCTALAGTEALASSERSELVAMFAQAGCRYPPDGLTMIALKRERRLEVWSLDTKCQPRLIADYPIYGASGTSGPKLAQGDLQVPEGIYHVEYLNPYSKFHLSIKLDYPNAFDLQMAKSDGRTDLGGDIFIHGNHVSKGCIAVGDIAIEEIYAMVQDMDGDPVKVIISPYDFRKEPAVIRTASTAPTWLPVLYRRIEREMRVYRKDFNDRQALAR